MDKLKSYLPYMLMVVGGVMLLFGDRIEKALPDGWKFSSPFVQPTVVVEGAWVVIVEETSDRTPEVISIATDAEYWKTVESRGMKWRFYDDDSPDAETYVPILNGQIPGLIVIGPDGRKLAAEKLPLTTKGIDEVIRRATGK